MFGASLYSSEYDDLRKWLKKAREESGLTIREVASKLEVHHSIIGKLESGDRKIELFEFVSYCKAVKSSPEDGFKKLISFYERSQNLQKKVDIDPRTIGKRSKHSKSG